MSDEEELEPTPEPDDVDELLEGAAASSSEESGEAEESTGEDDLEDAWGAALAEQADAEVVDEAEEGGDEIAPATYENLENQGITESRTPEDINLDVILDVPVTVSLEIGRTRMSIRNLLQLTQGSVVELDRLAGEPMDVLVNGTLIAHGEVVVVNDKFGIRLTDVISPAERLRKLR
ncbi:MAG TPA: flagellar motor switch protein FliN [Methylothermaceae bacterium]|nr:flagellar motor switch protein FliN [Methylothermaceae bacterium]